MKNDLKKKVIKRVFEIISEEIGDKEVLWNTHTPMQIKSYAMAKTGLEMSISKADVEHAVECYRKGEIIC